MTLRTFSFGGGVQSMAVLVLASQGRVSYDYFLFANVGEDSENPATLQYLRDHALPFAAKNGIMLLEKFRTWQRGERAGWRETLWGRLMKPDSKSLPIPVRMSNGAPGNRSCTADFKIRPIARWLREQGATPDSPAVTGLGISTDEVHRARTDSGIPYQTLEYPLIDLNLSRQDCRNIIARAGLPVPPKSSCYFCPFHSRAEWQRLKREQPDLFERSVELEQTLNERRQRLGKDEIYLHSSCKPLDKAVADQGALFTENELDNCESGYCMT